MRMLNIRGWIGERAFLVNERRQARIGRIATCHVWWRLVGADDPLPESFDMKEKGAYPKAFRASVMAYYPFIKEVVLAAKWAYEQGLQTLIKVSWVEHAKLLENLLKTVFPDEHVGRMDATIPDKVLDETQKSFEAGKIRILVGNKILGYGIDFKNLHVFIHAEAGKARHALYQAVGRGTRPKQGMPNVLYIIHVMCARHEKFAEHALEAIASYKKKAKKGVYVLHYNKPLELIKA
jgi:superfamily II DNA or RNA helicase